MKYIAVIYSQDLHAASKEESLKLNVCQETSFSFIRYVYNKCWTCNLFLALLLHLICCIKQYQGISLLSSFDDILWPSAYVSDTIVFSSPSTYTIV